MVFLSICVDEHQNILHVNHYQEKCLISKICDIFGIKSNYIGPVTPKKLKGFEKLDNRVSKCKKCVSMKRSKTTLQ